VPGPSQNARQLRNAIRDATSGLASPVAIQRLLDEALTGLTQPANAEDARAAADIARHAVVFLHDRTDRGDQAIDFIYWIESIVMDDAGLLQDEHLLLLEAIDSGKRRDHAGVTAAAGKALESSSVERVLEILGRDPVGEPEARDLAAIQLRCLAEYARALRIRSPSADAVRQIEEKANLLERFEAYASQLSAYALYRARLSVAYALRDTAGRWDDAGTLLAKATFNRTRDARTTLTDALHTASAARLEGAELQGHNFISISEGLIRRARRMEDECLIELTERGFFRHVTSFRDFRDRFFDPE
jgi:hypothetical protein